jgi:26S proteasome regulatory subunit N12
LLFFPSNTDLVKFAQQVGLLEFFPLSSNIHILVQRGWEVNPSTETVTFAKKHEEKIEIPKEKMIISALHYAKELEQIV